MLPLTFSHTRATQGLALPSSPTRFRQRRFATTITMGTLERRERERAELRQKILTAARELFAKHGVEAVTMRSIAEQVEYTATTIYGYFRDKDELIHALVSQDFYAFAQNFQSLAGIEDPALRLMGAARTFVRFGLEHPNHYRLMFMTPLPNVPPGKLGIAKGVCAEDAYAFLQQMVRDAQAAKMLLPTAAVDPELVGQFYFTSLHGLIAMHIAMDARGTALRDAGHEPAMLTPWIDWREIEQRFDFLCRSLFSSTLKPEVVANAYAAWETLDVPKVKARFAPIGETAATQVESKPKMKRLRKAVQA
jgi:AcrR family transcriptional regulator